MTTRQSAGTPRYVTDVPQLQSLARWSYVVRTRPGVEVHIGGAPADSLQRLQLAVNRSAAACGCHEGAFGLMFTVGATIAYWQLAAGSTASRSAKVWITIGLGFCGALVGKVFGLVRTQIHLRRSIRGFVAALQSGGGSSNAVPSPQRGDGDLNHRGGA